MSDRLFSSIQNRQRGQAAFTRIDQYLAATLPANVADADLPHVCDGVAQRAFREEAQGVVLDFNLVEVLDSEAFSAYANLSRALKLCGAQPVWVGLRPSVVCALFDLKISLENLPFLSATRLEDGLALLRDLSIQLSTVLEEQEHDGVADNDG